MRKRNEVTRIVLTAEEKAVIRAAAEKEGLPMAAWLRRIALAAAREAA
jgi:hypothetical protein